jgi:hypothetical protein
VSFNNLTTFKSPKSNEFNLLHNDSSSECKIINSFILTCCFLIDLIAFYSIWLDDKEHGISHITDTPSNRKKMAAESIEYNKKNNAAIYAKFDRTHLSDDTPVVLMKKKEETKEVKEYAKAEIKEVKEIKQEQIQEEKQEVFNQEVINEIIHEPIAKVKKTKVVKKANINIENINEENSKLNDIIMEQEKKIVNIHKKVTKKAT